MNWSKAKTVLIALFLITNLFLLANILNAAWKSAAVPEAIIDSTIQILTDQQITIDKEIIPRKNISMPAPTVQNAVQDYETFAKNLLGETITQTAADTYSAAGGAVQFQGNTFRCTFNYTPDTANSEKNTAQALLASLGFDVSSARAEISDDGATTVFTQQITGYPVFDCTLTVRLGNGGLEELSGCWFTEPKKPLFREKNTIKSAASALVDFGTDTARPQDALSIQSLTLGYSIGGNDAHQTAVTLLPVWRIQTETHGTFYRSAAENR